MAVLPNAIGTELGIDTPTSLQIDQWQSWIGQAEYLIAKRLAIAALNPADVDYVVLHAVVQHARHPSDETQLTVSVDDASTSRTYRSGVGRVVIPDDLWRLLDPTVGDSSAFSVTPYFESDLLL